MFELTLKFPFSFLLLNKKPSKLFIVPVAFKSDCPVVALNLSSFIVPGLKLTSALLILIGFTISAEENSNPLTLTIPLFLMRSYALVSIAFISKLVFNLAFKIPFNSFSSSIGYAFVILAKFKTPSILAFTNMLVVRFFIVAELLKTSWSILKLSAFKLM